jgi:hypothetical protein
MAGFGGAGFAYPPYAKMSLGCTVGYAYDLIQLGLRLDSAQFRPLLAHVDGEGFFGENFPAAVGPENSDRDFDFQAGLASFTHNLSRILQTEAP